MSLAMSKQEREAFLAATRVGVVSIPEAGRGPTTVPVWYHYEPGGVIRFATGKDSKKAKLLKDAARMSICVQTETAPYSYVSVEGPASVGAADYERDIKEMAHRYLGPEMGEGYLALQHPDGTVGDGVLVTLQPERWWTVDYSKMG